MDDKHGQVVHLPLSAQEQVRSEFLITSFCQAVEELLLNSLDAGATNIRVLVKSSNFEASVIDNGCGIPDTAMRDLIGQRSATSKKMTRTWDNQKSTFGFRGEALCSIAALSLLEVQSSFKGAQAWVKVTKGGKVLRFSELEGRWKLQGAGTIVRFSDLFFCCPVRRRVNNFHKQINDVKNIVQRLKLINPGLHLLVVDQDSDKQIFQCTPCADIPSCFALFFGQEKLEMVKKFVWKCDEITVKGLLSLPTAYCCHWTKEMQFIYVNKRPVEIDTVKKVMNTWFSKCCAIPDTITSTQPLQQGKGCPPQQYGQFPIFVLDLECPPAWYELAGDQEGKHVEFFDLITLKMSITGLLLTFISKFQRSGFDRILKDLYHLRNQMEIKRRQQIQHVVSHCNIRSKHRQFLASEEQQGPLCDGKNGDCLPYTPGRTHNRFSKHAYSPRINGANTNHQAHSPGAAVYPTTGDGLGGDGRDTSQCNSTEEEDLGMSSNSRKVPGYNKCLLNCDKQEQQQTESPFFLDQQIRGKNKRPRRSFDEAPTTKSHRFLPTFFSCSKKDGNGPSFSKRPDSLPSRWQLFSEKEEAQAMVDSNLSVKVVCPPSPVYSMQEAQPSMTNGICNRDSHISIIQYSGVAADVDHPCDNQVACPQGRDDPFVQDSGMIVLSLSPPPSPESSLCESSSEGHLSAGYQVEKSILPSNTEAILCSNQITQSEERIASGYMYSSRQHQDDTTDGKNQFSLPSYTLGPQRGGEAPNDYDVVPDHSLHGCRSFGKFFSPTEKIECFNTNYTTTDSGDTMHAQQELCSSSENDQYTSFCHPSPEQGCEATRSITSLAQAAALNVKASLLLDQSPVFLQNTCSEEGYGTDLCHSAVGTTSPYCKTSRQLAFFSDTHQHPQPRTSRWGKYLRSKKTDGGNDAPLEPIHREESEEKQEDGELISASLEPGGIDLSREGECEHLLNSEETVSSYLMQQEELKQSDDLNLSILNSSRMAIKHSPCISSDDQSHPNGSQLGFYSSQDAEASNNNEGEQQHNGCYDEPYDAKGLSVLDERFGLERAASTVAEVVTPQKWTKLTIPTNLSAKDLSNAAIIGQLDRKFILCRVSSADGGDERLPTGTGGQSGSGSGGRGKVSRGGLLLAVDQHAADERVRLEALEAQIYGASRTEKHVRKVKISPTKKIRVSCNEADVADSYKEELASWGFCFNRCHESSEATTMGGHEWLTLTALPEVLGVRLAPADLQDLLARLVEAGGTRGAGRGAGGGGAGAARALLCRPRAVQRVLNSKACRYAIMFGDELRLDECKDLISKLAACELPFQCAHGRPSAVPLFDLSFSSQKESNDSRAVGEKLLKQGCGQPGIRIRLQQLHPSCRITAAISSETS